MKDLKINQYDLHKIKLVEYNIDENDELLVIPNTNNFNRNAKMHFSFLANDNGYHEFGYVIPYLTVKSRSSSKYIDIQFDDLILLSKMISNRSITYLIKKVDEEDYDASSIPINNIAQDIVLHIRLENELLILSAHYSHINEKFDINNIKDQELFTVKYELFKQFVQVAKNCIFTDAEIQRRISSELPNLLVQTKRMIPNLLNSFTRDVSYYIQKIKGSSPLRKKDLMNLVPTRTQLHSSKIETNVIFLSKLFTTFPEAFFISLEEFTYLASQLLKGDEAEISAQNVIANFSLSKNHLIIVAKLFDENNEKIWDYSLAIDKKLFISMYETVSKDFFQGEIK
jgi:hypothetical protein